MSCEFLIADGTSGNCCPAEFWGDRSGDAGVVLLTIGPFVKVASSDCCVGQPQWLSISALLIHTPHIQRSPLQFSYHDMTIRIRRKAH